MESEEFSAVSEGVRKIFKSREYRRARESKNDTRYNDQTHGHLYLADAVLERKGFGFGLSEFEDKSGRVEFTIAIQPLVENALSSARVPATVVWIGPGVKDLGGSTAAGMGQVSATARLKPEDALFVLRGVVDAFSDITDEMAEGETDKGLGRLRGINKALDDGCTIYGLPVTGEGERRVTVGAFLGQKARGQGLHVLYALARADADYLTGEKDAKDEKVWDEYHRLRWKHQPELTDRVAILDAWQKQGISWSVKKVFGEVIVSAWDEKRGLEPEGRGKTFEAAVRDAARPGNFSS